MKIVAGEDYLTGSDGIMTILLAGGRGQRLGALTAHQAKPAVSLLDGRRIVDFAMHNAWRSGLRRMLVCTQWKPASLVAHLRARWTPAFPDGLVICDGHDRGGVTGYRGTAHAVACIAADLDAAGTREVIVLAADHVYDMDYREMLAAHRRMGLPVTVAALPVARDEARSFGVFETEGPSTVRRFLEKPADPPAMFGRADRALISMGIYVFDWAWLREELGCGATPVTDPPLDFGYDLLPGAVARGAVGVFRFVVLDAEAPPYWRDVGTVQAMEAARADLSRKNPPIALPDYPAFSGHGRNIRGAFQ